MESDSRIVMGRLFHKLGAAKANVRSPVVFSRDLSCTKSDWEDDLSTPARVYDLSSSIKLSRQWGRPLSKTRRLISLVTLDLTT